MPAIQTPPVSGPGSTSASPAPTPALLARIRSEYMEMPGLRLTLLQARRLWAVDALTCASALAALEAAGFLGRTRDGAFVRANGERLTA
jgi:hypothetical protein